MLGNIKNSDRLPLIEKSSSDKTISLMKKNESFSFSIKKVCNSLLNNIIDFLNFNKSSFVKTNVATFHCDFELDLKAQQHDVMPNSNRRSKAIDVEVNQKTENGAQCGAKQNISCHKKMATNNSEGVIHKEKNQGKNSNYLSSVNGMILPSEVEENRNTIKSLMYKIDLLENKTNKPASASKKLFIYQENEKVESNIEKLLNSNDVDELPNKFDNIIKKQEYIIDNLTQKLKETKGKHFISNIAYVSKQPLLAENIKEMKRINELKYNSSQNSSLEKVIIQETDPFIYEEDGYYIDYGHIELLNTQSHHPEIDFSEITKNTLYSNEPSHLIFQLKSDNNKKDTAIKKLELKNTQLADNTKDYIKLIQELNIKLNDKNKQILDLTDSLKVKEKQPNELISPISIKKNVQKIECQDSLSSGYSSGSEEIVSEPDNHIHKLNIGANNTSGKVKKHGHSNETLTLEKNKALAKPHSKHEINCLTAGIPISSTPEQLAAKQASLRTNKR